MIIISEDYCPRCNQYWSERNSIGSDFYCDNCQLGYQINVCIWINNIISYGDRLFWSLPYQECDYWLNKNHTRIPWLLFNISSNKLKTYLMIS
jgi:hypothetical protein